jgi:predicted transcriptional regulator
MSGKITIEDARDIRREAAAGVPESTLAQRYGVHASVIANIVAGRTFREST